MRTLNNVIALIGSILGIIAFFWQFWPKLTRIAYRSGSRWEELISEAFNALHLSISKLFEARFLSGVLFSLAAAFFWSLSYTSFRTDAVRHLNSLEIGIPVFFIGSVTIYVLALVASLFHHKDNTSTQVLAPLWTWNGTGIILGNVFEFLFFIAAVHLITAGQTIALYKTNPLWMLFLLFLINRERAARASIAAVFCVFIGVYTILSSDFAGPADIENLTGSGLAILGGVCFAIYSISVFNYPLRYENSTAAQRFTVHATVFLLSAILLIVFAVITKIMPSYTKESFIILAMNGLRIGIVYVFYTEALKRIHPVLVACLVALEVPLTMVVEYFWLDELANRQVVYGSLIILIGILSIIKENELFKQRMELAKKEY